MRKKLLLADDSITIQKVVELTFPSDEFEVVTAGNGRLAVDKAMTFLPDMVLCDVIMPQLDGYQVCEALRALPELKNVPILLLNGAFEPYDAEKALAVGALGNVSKPFDPPALVARVKEILAAHSTAALERRLDMSLDGTSGVTAIGDIDADAQAMDYADAEVPSTLPSSTQSLGPETVEADFSAGAADFTPGPVDFSYDESETAPVSTVEVPLGIREMAARSLALDSPVFAEPEPEVLTSEAELSDFSETLHGPLDAEAQARPIEAEPEPTAAPGEVAGMDEVEAIESEPLTAEPAIDGFPPEGELQAPTDFETPGAFVENPEAAAFAPEPLAAADPEPFEAAADAPFAEPEPSIPSAPELVTAGDMEPEALEPATMPEFGAGPEPAPESAPESTYDDAEGAISHTLPPTFAPLAAAKAESPLGGGQDFELGEIQAEAPPAAEPEPMESPAEPKPSPESEHATAVATSAALPSEPEFQAMTLPAGPEPLPAVPAPVVAAAPVAGRVPAPAPPASPGPKSPTPASPAPFDTDTAAGAFDNLVGVADPSPVSATSGAGPVSAEVAVPVDMVQQIAQRVISQVSERVIREIAWDVIPGLAEKLIKAEIERIKARAESERD